MVRTGFLTVLLSVASVSELSGDSSGYESEAASSECLSVDDGSELDKDAPQRRVRTKFTPEQISKLEKIFAKHKYLDSGKRVKTAQKLLLTETQVGGCEQTASAAFTVLSHTPLGTNRLHSRFLLGENLVSEQEDEGETGGAGLSPSTSLYRRVPAAAAGALPQRGRTARRLPGELPGLLPAPRAADGAPAADARSPPSSYDAKPTLLLKKLQKTFPTQTLRKSAIQSFLCLCYI